MAGLAGVNRFYDFAISCLPWSAPCFCSLWPLLLIFLPLILTLESCILILLAAHHTNALASERGQSRSSGGEAVAVMATVAKGYDLDYAWRAVGEAYRGAGYYLAAAEAGEPPGTWWGPGAERLGFVAGQQVEREPYNLLFGQRKGPDGAKLGPGSGERREGC